jgi:hypothetical protein
MAEFMRYGKALTRFWMCRIDADDRFAIGSPNSSAGVSSFQGRVSNDDSYTPRDTVGIHGRLDDSRALQDTLRRTNR